MSKKLKRDEDEDVDVDVKRRKIYVESPTSINIIETAKLSDISYNPIEKDDFPYICQYIFEIHNDVICPKPIITHYDEIRLNRNMSDPNDVKSEIKNIDTLIDFVENKCTNYRFVASILVIRHFIMDDLTDSEKDELLHWDRNDLKSFVVNKIVNKNIPVEQYTKNFRGHSNIILIDKELKQVERFEPHGFLTHMASANLNNILNESFGKIGYTYFSPEGFSTIRSVQGIHGLAQNPIYRDLGYCTVWSLWYLDTRLLNPSKTRDYISLNILRMFKDKDEKFIHETVHSYWTNLIRYIELRKEKYDPKKAMDIMHEEAVGKDTPLRDIKKYRKPPPPPPPPPPPEVKPQSLLSKIFGSFWK